MVSPSFTKISARIRNSKPLLFLSGQCSLDHVAVGDSFPVVLTASIQESHEGLTGRHFSSGDDFKFQTYSAANADSGPVVDSCSVPSAGNFTGGLGKCEDGFIKVYHDSPFTPPLVSLSRRAQQIVQDRDTKRSYRTCIPSANVFKSSANSLLSACQSCLEAPIGFPAEGAFFVYLKRCGFTYACASIFCQSPSSSARFSARSIAR
jgi:hypothetical protein